MLYRRGLLGGCAGLACGCGRFAFAQRPVFPRLRCGFVDPPHSTSGGLTPQSYALKGASRGKSALTWNFTGTVPGVGGAGAVVPVLNRAFALWRGAVPALTFTQSANNPDITIQSGPLAAGVGGLTTPDGRSITFTTAATFAPNAAANPAANDLLNTATHEIGHALGMLHATTTASIMWPIGSGQEALGPDDVAGIKALYGWAPQNKLQGGTEQSPALCACGGTLAMVWRGSGHDHNIWISTTTDGVSWTPQRAFRDVGTIGSPGLAWDGRKLWMVWRGTGDDQGLYFKNSGDFFVRDNPGQQKIGGVGSSHGARIAIVSGVPTMAWKGVNDDHRIFVTRFVGGKWQGQSVVPSVGTSAAPAICQDIDGGARLLWRGINDDHVLWSTSSAAGAVPLWQPQHQLTWTVTGNATSGTVSTGTAGSLGGPGLTLVGNIVQAAWRGAANDQGLWFTQLAKDAIGGTTLNQWSSQANVPRVGSSDGPSIASFNGKLHMVWKGVQNDTGLYHSSL